MNGDDYAPDWWYISDDYAPVEDNNGECDDYAPDEDDRAETKKRGFLGDPDDDIDNNMITSMMMISLMMTIMMTMLLMKMTRQRRGQGSSSANWHGFAGRPRGSSILSSPSSS